MSQRHSLGHDAKMEITLRLGDEVLRKIHRVVLYGTDVAGDFAIVVLSDQPEDPGTKVTGFDLLAHGHDVVIIGGPAPASRPPAPVQQTSAPAQLELRPSHSRSERTARLLRRLQHWRQGHG